MNTNSRTISIAISNMQYIRKSFYTGNALCTSSMNNIRNICIVNGFF